jgi:hypothetical protein
MFLRTPLPSFTGGSTATLPVLAQATFGVPGSSDVSFRDQSGGRFTVGYWFDDAHCFALEASGFFLSPRNIDATTSTGTNLLTFPLSVMIPGTTGTPGSAAILTLAANAQLRATSFNEMWGAEVNGRSGKCWIGPVSFEGFGGLRYINLEEDFSSTESISLTGIPALTNFPLTPAPAGFSFFDAIHTRNQFYGAQLGAMVDCCCGCFFLNATGKLGLGDMHQAVNLEGGALSLTPPHTYQRRPDYQSGRPGPT